MAEMRDVYAPRRQSYLRTVAELPAQAARRRVEARLLRQAAGPLPGPLIGVEEADPEPGPESLVEVGALASAVADRVSLVNEDFSADLLRAGTLLDRLRM
jgi:hypothetical protein